MTDLTEVRRERLRRAYGWHQEDNVIGVDFAPKDETKPGISPTAVMIIDTFAGVLVFCVIVGATLALLWLPGAH